MPREGSPLKPQAEDLADRGKSMKLIVFLFQFSMPMQ